ncbi:MULTISPECIES: hypothetical protein [unclassified Methylobacterium]|uniref:hypothetical protein n=1 Tax=unclassified Methylobacterium TaxID=2615210 RepID=UPI0007008C8C|nr:MULTISPECIES: hypothetical protein [unclassified Methylobacterium]KQO74180.1 hypothetical protein ASF20_02495 [Methylobacterium sp. Leaf88]KQU35262.1 hypothetical protein ASG63_01115 [Methylobacterium sp. Leaf94]
MSIKTLAFAGSIALALTGTAFAQTATGTESNMNNPGSVKSNSEKSMERMGAPATTGSTMAPAGTSGGPSTATVGAPGGSTGGNGETGSGAAPSGK